MFEMVRIAAVPGACKTDYVEGLLNFYQHRFDNSVPDFAPKDMSEGFSSVTPWDRASELMFSAMNLKKKLELHG